MKKRLISTAIAFIMAVNLVLVPDGAAVFTAGAAISGDWEYIVNDDGTATVTKYRGTGSSITVPSSLNGKKVTGLGVTYSSVFGDSIKSVTIPNSVKTIGGSAFYGCKSLTSVTIPNSVTSIEYRAFYRCGSLTSVTIPNSVKYIGYEAFYGCEILKSVAIPNSVTNIEDSAFYNCTGLKSVTIGNGVTSIGTEAFGGCSSLTSVRIPGSVTSIGSSAFYNCNAFLEITGVAGSAAEEHADKYNIAFLANLYLINFNINGGTGSTPQDQSITKNTLVSEPQTPTRKGYKFGGWYKESSLKNKWNFSTDKATKSITLYAKWTAETYKITYKLGSSSAKNSSSAPKTYTYGKSVTLKKPTRSGYAFAGWYTDEKKSSSSKITSISNTRTGNITLYAKWVKLPVKPTSVKATANSTSKITVTWKKVSNVDGYEVYRATSKDGKYTKVKTVSKGTTVKYADKSLKSNKKYYYKVRAYKLVDGKKVYGEYSAVKSATTKK